MKVLERLTHMKGISLLLIALAMAASAISAWSQTSMGTDAARASQTAKEVRGATPYAEIKSEPGPMLIVDPPLPDLLARGVVWIQWRVENVHIYRCSGRAHSTYLHASDICTYKWTTCLGGGPTRAMSTRSTWPGCRGGRTRSRSVW
jgi:hypothetical protein